MKRHGPEHDQAVIDAAYAVCEWFWQHGTHHPESAKLVADLQRALIAGELADGVRDVTIDPPTAEQASYARSWGWDV